MSSAFSYQFNQFSEEGSHQVIWWPVWKDVSGSIIANKANQLPVKPTYEPKAIFIYEFTSLVQQYDDDKWRAQHDTLNSLSWRGWAAHEAWCSVSWSKVSTDSAQAFEIKYLVRCIKNGWKVEIPNVGYSYLDSGSLKDFVTSDGTPYMGALDSSGGALAAGTAFDVLSFRTKPEVDFSAFLPS